MKGGKLRLDEQDKTIEVIKAAMEKEEMEKNSEKSVDEKIDECTCDDEAVSTGNEEPVNEKKKSGKLLQKSSKNKELAAKEEQIAQLNDKLIRTMAEFDNFRKRSEKEKAQMFDMGVKNIVEKILPIIDNFERGLSSVNEEDKETPLVQGFNMIYKQLMTTMDEIGVKAIEAVGHEFDPTYHNAVMHGEDEELGENIVAEEFQKGYMYRDTVVRHSMVKVVN
jgi:molecular chaperone GrpE